jgi:sugar/nucleoside kinase (ribokinase family)
MSKLLIVGTVAFDAIETPFGKTDKILGGSAPYIGLSASQFDINSAIVSVVGDDFPIGYLEMLNRKNIDTSGIEIVKGGETFFWKGKYHNDLNSRDTLITELNVLADFKPVVPDNWMDNTWDELLEVLKKIDVITINDEEARQLSGEYSLVKAAQRIAKFGPKYVVIKKGEHGALLFHKGNIFFAPALPLEEVFDPTGAGDTFAGGFIGYLASTKDISFENMKNALIYGSNLASFSVEKFGTRRMEYLTGKEIQKRLRRFKELTQFEIELN